MSLKSALSNPLTLVFVVAGVLIIALTVVNYFQDGRIGLGLPMGFVIIFLGLLLGGFGKKRGDGDA